MCIHNDVGHRPKVPLEDAPIRRSRTRVVTSSADEQNGASTVATRLASPGIPSAPRSVVAALHARYWGRYPIGPWIVATRWAYAAYVEAHRSLGHVDQAVRVVVVVVLRVHVSVPPTRRHMALG